jgi:uncharacterized protein (UPF0335 family)
MAAKPWFEIHVADFRVLKGCCLTSRSLFRGREELRPDRVLRRPDVGHNGGEPMPPKTKPKAAIGHNSTLSAADRDKLKSLVDRIEAIEEERAGLAEDVQGLYAEATSAGFDAGALRQIIKLRKQDAAERDARRVTLDAYMAALGDYASTPLGQAALARASSELMPPV